jgi:hypothetical protein
MIPGQISQLKCSQAVVHPSGPRKNDSQADALLFNSCIYRAYATLNLIFYSLRLLYRNNSKYRNQNQWWAKKK